VRLFTNQTTPVPGPRPSATALNRIDTLLCDVVGLLSYYLWKSYACTSHSQ